MSTGMNTMRSDVERLLHLVQFADTAFPVGGFAFSQGLESAAMEHVVRDAATLEEYVRTMMRQAATTDSVAALAAWRAWHRGDIAGVEYADRRLEMCRVGAETRQMLSRMGRKALELGAELTGDAMLCELLARVRRGAVAGCYPVVQGVMFATAGLSERELFAAQQYGTMSMLLSAALRCIRISHLETQRIMFRLAAVSDTLFDEAGTLTTEEMHAFAPVADILAAIHEKGTSRMFMG